MEANERNIRKWLYVDGSEHYFTARAFKSPLIVECCVCKHCFALKSLFTLLLQSLTQCVTETLRPRIKCKKSTIKMIHSHSSNQYQWYCNIFVISSRLSISLSAAICAVSFIKLLLFDVGCVHEARYLCLGAWNILLVFDFKSAINLIYSIKAR